MADIVVRLLRDGSTEGESALEVLLKDSVGTVGAEAIFLRFAESLCSAVSAGRAAAKGAVLLALAHPPERYHRDLTSLKCLQMVDCYTDPLGWNSIPTASSTTDPGTSIAPESLPETGNQLPLSCGPPVRVLLEDMKAAVLQAGTESAKEGRFVVIIDSVSALVRYLPAASVMAFLDSLRSHARISSILARVHEDLHDALTVHALEYLASIIVSVEPPPVAALPPATSAVDGRLFVRHKRRNGKVRELVEEYRIDENGGVEFAWPTGPGHLRKPQSVPSSSTSSSSKFQVSFNLQLSEAERADKARVVLPYEHQGNGRELKIYDGRPGVGRGSLQGGLGRGQVASGGPSDVTGLPRASPSGGGEIHYVRDSDEDADSDEDLDDDLDI